MHGARGATSLAEARGATPRCMPPWAWPGALEARWSAQTEPHLAEPERASDVPARARRPVQGRAHGAAVGRARARRLSGHPRQATRRHHHRRLDPVGARAGAGRAGDRATGRASSRPARAGRGCSELLRAHSREPARAAAAAARRRRRLSVEDVSVRPPGEQRLVVAGVSLRAEGRQGARHHRPERLGQVVAGARARRRLAAGARQGAPRRRRARPVVAGGARPPHRLSAAGRRAVRRHGRREHRPLRARRRIRRRSSRPPRRPACTS